MIGDRFGQANRRVRNRLAGVEDMIGPAVL
jgi:hypothetical protein